VKLSLNVAVSQWRAGDFDVVLAGGPHELPSDDVKLSAGLVRAIAAAAAAGVVEILDANAAAAKIIDGAVQSDEDSLEVYEEAVASGAWLDGHLQDVIAQREQAIALLDEQLAAGIGDEELDQRDALRDRKDFDEHLLTDARTRLAAHRGEA